MNVVASPEVLEQAKSEVIEMVSAAESLHVIGVDRADRIIDLVGKLVVLENQEDGCTRPLTDEEQESEVFPLISTNTDGTFRYFDAIPTPSVAEIIAIQGKQHLDARLLDDVLCSCIGTSSLHPDVMQRKISEEVTSYLHLNRFSFDARSVDGIDTKFTVMRRPFIVMGGRSIRKDGGIKPSALLHEVNHLGQYLPEGLVERRRPSVQTDIKTHRELDAYYVTAAIISAAATKLDWLAEIVDQINYTKLSAEDSFERHFMIGPLVLGHLADKQQADMICLEPELRDALASRNLLEWIEY